MIHVSRGFASLAAKGDTTRHKQGSVLPASVAHLMEQRWTLCWLVERWLFPGPITPTRMVEWQGRVNFLCEFSLRITWVTSDILWNICFRTPVDVSVVGIWSLSRCGIIHAASLNQKVSCSFNLRISLKMFMTLLVFQFAFLFWQSCDTTDATLVSH